MQHTQFYILDYPNAFIDYSKTVIYIRKKYVYINV